MLFHAFNGQRARIVEGGMVVGPRRALMTILHADHVPLLGALRGAGLPTAVSVYVVSWR